VLPFKLQDIWTTAAGLAPHYLQILPQGVTLLSNFGETGCYLFTKYPDSLKLERRLLTSPVQTDAQPTTGQRYSVMGFI
jgi:hypothetical protein